MTVVQFDVFDIDDPNGTPLGTIDDTEAEALDFRVGYRGDPGEGHVRINRHHSAAALIAPDRIYKAKIPAIDSDYLYAFIQKDADYTLAHPKEEGAETLELIGPGLKALFAQARLYWSVYAPGQTARGSEDYEHNLWKWVNEPYGAIATRAIEEGINQPGAPLADMVLTFTRTHDSDGVPWANIAEEWQTTVGTDVLTVLAEMEQHGDFYIEVLPDLTVNAYQTSPGRDLTGSVHVQKGAELMTSLRRRIHGRPAIDHLILEASNGDYSLEVAPGASGRGSWGYYKAPTNDDTTLNKIGQEVMRASRSSLQPIEFEVDPLVYLPGPEGSDNGDYWPGDTILLSTGTGPQDYDESEHLVTGLRFSLDKAVVDTDASSRARSLRIVTECNVEVINQVDPKQGFGNPAASGMRLCGRGRTCEELTAADLTAAAATNGGGESGVSTQWTAGTVQTSQRHSGTNSIGFASTADGTVVYTWDPAQVFSAGVRYVVDVWSRRNGSHIDSDLKLGVAGGDEEVDLGLTAADFLDTENGADGDQWGLYRICWTPNEDRTGVRFSFRDRQTGSSYFGVDDLSLSTADASDDITGSDSAAARCDHSHRHNDLPGRNSPDAHTAAAIGFVPNGSIAATNVQAAIQEVRDEAGGGTPYTDEMAQDAIGTILGDTATIDATYADGTPLISFAVIPGGIKIDDLGAPDDNTDLNATTGAHGLLRKLDNDATHYLNGTGAWSEPAAGTGGVTPWVIPPLHALSHVRLGVIGAANRCVFWPVVVPKACTVTGLRIRIGTQSGNIGVAMYSEDLATRIATSGSVACPAPGLQTVAFSAGAVVAAGRYWLALSFSSATASFSRSDDNATVSPAVCKFMDTAHPPPASLTSGGDTVVQPNVLGLISGVSGYP